MSSPYVIPIAVSCPVHGMAVFATADSAEKADDAHEECRLNFQRRLSYKFPNPPRKSRKRVAL